MAPPGALRGSVTDRALLMQTPSPPPADSGSRRSTPPDNVISGEVQGHGPLQLEDLPEATHGPESPDASGSNVAPLLEGLVMEGKRETVHVTRGSADYVARLTTSLG